MVEDIGSRGAGEGREWEGRGKRERRGEKERRGEGGRERRGEEEENRG